MTLRFISLFAGIGGIDLGLERSGMQCVAQVEINEHARSVLKKHWPDVPRYRDIRSVSAWNLPACDVLAGGFPCQDISNAGKRAGITGERSGLWTEFARLIRELRPQYVLVENVAALINRGLSTVLGDLAACGYDAEWDCIPASAVGAPHTRERLFIVAYPNCNRLEAMQVYTPAAYQAITAQSVAGISNGTWRGELCSTPSGRVRLLPNTGSNGMADGVSFGMERLRGLGGAVVPQVAELLGHLIMNHWRATH